MSQVDVTQVPDEQSETPVQGLGQEAPQAPETPQVVVGGEAPVEEPVQAPDPGLSSEPEVPVDEPEVPAEAPQPVEGPAGPTVQERAANLSDDLKSAAARFTHGVAEVVPVSSSSRSNLVHYGIEAVLVVSVIALGFAAFGLSSDKDKLNNKLSAAYANPQQLVQKQTDDIIGNVAALMQVPTNETPTVADVTDANAARAQSNFFANAQNGDKVLMYVKAGEAILYRPGDNKIVLVAPLTFNNQAAGTTSTTKR